MLRRYSNYAIFVRAEKTACHKAKGLRGKPHRIFVMHCDTEADMMLLIRRLDVFQAVADWVEQRPPLRCMERVVSMTRKRKL